MHILGVDIQHTTGSAKSLVPAAKINGSDTILTEHRGAHDAWLDSDIEIRLIQDADGMLGQDAGDGDELGMPGAIQGAVRFVHASADDFAIFDKHTTNGRLIALECQFGLEQVMSQHVFLYLYS